MSEQEQMSRIGAAKERALGAKQKIVAVSLAAFVGLVGLAWASHPGSHSSSSSASLNEDSFGQTSTEGNDSLGDQSDDFGGFDSSGSIAPSGGSQPQAQTHVS